MLETQPKRYEMAYSLNMVSSMSVARMREAAESLSDDGLEAAFSEVQQYLEAEIAFPRELWRKGFTARFEEQFISLKYAPKGKLMLWRAALLRAADSRSD